MSPTSPSLNFAPVAALLENNFQGDPHEAAARLYEVASYLTKVPDPNDTASYLREVLAIVNGVAAAFDTMVCVAA